MIFPADQTHRFPIRSALLSLPHPSGAVADVARMLADGVVSYLATDVCADKEAEALLAGGMMASMPPIAALRPLGTAWVEAPHTDGTRYGLLCGCDARGEVWLRRIDVGADGEMCCPRVVLRKLPAAVPAEPTVASWTAWALGNLVSETLDPTLEAAEVSEALDSSAVRDLLVVALLTADPGLS